MYVHIELAQSGFWGHLLFHKLRIKIKHLIIRKQIDKIILVSTFIRDIVDKLSCQPLMTICWMRHYRSQLKCLILLAIDYHNHFIDRSIRNDLIPVPVRITNVLVILETLVVPFFKIQLKYLLCKLIKALSIFFDMFVVTDLLIIRHDSTSVSRHF